eukprot:Nitzschia sp. Nitz4//scaffold13_size275219//204704//205390//NITZ4_000902-RA/size275219-snap-gene-0.21-mRNA-1//1//CDS//3329536098//8932//frame0
MTYQRIISSSGLDDLVKKKQAILVVDDTKLDTMSGGTAKVAIPQQHDNDNNDESQSLLPRSRRRVHFAPSANLETIRVISCIDTTILSLADLWWQRHELKEFMARIPSCLEKCKSKQTKRMRTRSDNHECLLGVERYDPSRLSTRKQAIGIILAGQKQPQHRSDDPTFLWRVSKRCSLQSRLHAAKMGNDLFQELLQEDEQDDASSSGSPAKKRRRV